MTGTWYRRLRGALAGIALGLAVLPAAAVERVGFGVSGNDSALRDDLIAASLTVAAVEEDRTSSRDLLAAALADYARLLETLYAHGYYSAVINIRLDGREAAEIPLLAVPARVDTVNIFVRPGPPFRFSQARLAPLAPGTELPKEFRPGGRAESTVVRDAVEDGIEGWRDVGFAKAEAASQDIVADHARATLSAEVALNPGPRVRFGNLILTTPSRVRAARIRAIAGIPSGAVFSPETLERMARRLRRTGAFASVSLTEAETLGPGNTMDIRLALADQKPRRFGFGAELATLEGLEVSGYWLHRNLFGGAERLRVEGSVSNVGGTSGGTDYRLGTRLDIPAVLDPDTDFFATANIQRQDEPDYLSDSLSVGAGLKRYFSDRFEGEAGVAYIYSQTTDAVGERTFSLLSFPTQATFDARDEPLDPTDGYYIEAHATPFLGLDGSATGVRTYGDGRIYRGLGAADRVVLAGRLQIGSVAGAALTETQPDFLFHSGGGGTVRGQPYKSLGVDLGGGAEIGGRSFVGVSAEARVAINDRIGAVVFADAGYIGAESFYDGSGEWHSGAGVGIRYKTGLGPIRLDVAGPVSGRTGGGIQVYIGIGQAF